MAANPIDPSKPARSDKGTAVVMMKCPTCKKLTPHTTPGTKHNPNLGGKSQAMACSICGTLSDVATGPGSRDFQSNVDAPDGSE